MVVSVIKCKTERTEEFFRAPMLGQPLLIAEAGVAHFGSLERAFELVDMAFEADFDCVKFQHFNIDLLVHRQQAQFWYDRLSDRCLRDEEIIEVAAYATKRGIAFACTGHELQALKFLNENIELPFIKLGSGEWRNLELLDYGITTDLPILISTGMHSHGDVSYIERYCGEKASNPKRIFFLNCVTDYPTLLADVNLGFLQEKILGSPYIWGHSDHCESNLACISAITLGARIIERHIALERDTPNAQDWRVSSMPDNANSFVRECRDIFSALENSKKPTEEEVLSREWAAKSPYVTGDKVVGEVLTKADIQFVRPYFGTSPMEISDLFGMPVSRTYKDGDAFDIDLNKEKP